MKKNEMNRYEKEWNQTFIRFPPNFINQPNSTINDKEWKGIITNEIESVVDELTTHSAQPFIHFHSFLLLFIPIYLSWFQIIHLTFPDHVTTFPPKQPPPSPFPAEVTSRRFWTAWGSPTYLILVKDYLLFFILEEPILLVKGYTL